MSFVRAGQLARQVPTARADDPLGLVAENLRASHYGTLPVLDRSLLGESDAPPSPQDLNARVVGLVDERDLSGAVLVLASNLAGAGVPVAAGNFNGGAAPIELNGHAALNGIETPELSNEDSGEDEPAAATVAELRARDVMRRDVGIVPAAFSLHNALLALDRYGCLALPVVDAHGCYRGMISRSDVVAALGRQVRPPVVGGMATPLGVWLTTGSLSAGAPPLGLFLSGVTLAFCSIAAQLVMLLALTKINALWGMMYYSGRLGGAAEASGTFNLAVTLAESLLFLLALRALPMAGIHAAEHQTVWAIERGLPLTPEFVAQMPRAHPRCGTNLVALAGLITILFRHAPSFSAFAVLIKLVIVFFLWRSFGKVLQEWFTTRPASPRQLASGISAGRELLEKYQQNPHQIGSFGFRLLNSGIAWSALGMILSLSLYDWAKVFVARLIFGLG